MASIWLVNLCVVHSPQAFYENTVIRNNSARFIGVYIQSEYGVLEFLLFLVLANVVLAIVSAEQISMATQQWTRQCGPAGVLCELVSCVLQLVK